MKKPTFDLGNLLCTWEKSLESLAESVHRIKKHIENGRPDSAGVRASETLKAISKMQEQICGVKKCLLVNYHNGVEKQL